MSTLLDTNNVNIFPTALRGIGSGLFTTENNLSSIIRTTTSNYSFVDNPKEGGPGTYNMTLVIHGYIFELTGVSLVENTPMYAMIKINSNGMLVNYSAGTTSLDLNGKCTCIEFSDTPPASTQLNRGEYSGEITDESGAKFNVYALQIFNGTNIVNTNKTSVSSLDTGNKAIGSESEPVYIAKDGTPKPCTNNTAKKLGTANVGSSNQPIYLNEGSAEAVGYKIIISEDQPANPSDQETAKVIWLKPMNLTNS